jgi:hypothetical protein
MVRWGKIELRPKRRVKAGGEQKEGYSAQNQDLCRGSHETPVEDQETDARICGWVEAMGSSLSPVIGDSLFEGRESEQG